MDPKIISKKIKYKGFWTVTEEETIRFPDGKIVKWESVISDDAVVIVALDNKKNIYLSKEWRVAWEKDVLQIPAGMCKGKTGTEILKQAKNELSEELGFGAKKWEKLITFLLSGRQRCKIHVFLAQDLYKSPKTPDDDERIKVVKVPFKKACDIFLGGKKETVSFTIIGLALAKERLKL